MAAQVYLNSLTIGIVLFVAYYLQGIVYPSGSIISQGILLIFLLLGLSSFINSLLYRRNPNFVSFFILFYLMIALWYIISPKTVYGTINEAIGAVSTLGQFKSASIFSLSFFIAYSNALRNSVADTSIFKFAVTFFILALLRYLYSKFTLSQENESFTNNAGYYFVAFLPLIPIVVKQHKIIGFLMMLISIIAVFASAKRGAILCLLVVGIFAFIYYVRSNKLSAKHIIIAILCLCGVGILGYYSYQSNDYLIGRMEYMQEEGIGTRSIAYSILWNHWKADTNLFTFLLGNGTAATVGIWGNFAHNDWLEILIDHGFLGVILYIMLFMALFVYIKNVNLNFNYKLALYLCLIVWFLKTIFSMSYTDTANAFFMFMLGAVIGSYERQKHISNIQKN